MGRQNVICAALHVLQVTQLSLLGKAVSRILSKDVTHIHVVLLTDVLHEIRIGLERGVTIQRERLGIRARIVNSDFEFQVCEMGARRSQTRIYR